MGGIGLGLEHLVKAGDAAAVFGRAIAFSGNEAGIGRYGITGAHIADGELMLPVIAEVVNVVDPGRAGGEYVAQACARDRKSTRLNSSHQCAHRMPSSA